jgi:hypothetical protein
LAHLVLAVERAFGSGGFVARQAAFVPCFVEVLVDVTGLSGWSIYADAP